jgi:hypothetical protein
MTTPVQHGHPDWARTISAADILVIDTGTVQQNNVTEVRGRFFVGNLPHIWVRIFCDAGGVRLRLHWYQAATGGSAIAENLVDARFISIAEGPFAVLAPFVEVTTIVDAVGRNVNCRVWQGLQASQTDTQNAGSGLLSQFQSNVNAGVINTYDAVLIRWGWGYWTSTFDNPASYGIRLNAVDYLGNVTLLGYHHSANKNPGGPIILPPQRMQITAHNNTAAAHVVTFTVFAHPGPL